jgi:hypothetical protein
LLVDLDNDKEKSETFTFWGGGIALVQLVQHCLKKAMKKIPVCGRVVESNELAELTTLNKSLHVITRLANMHNFIMVGITAVGGMDAVVEVMKTFPKCQALQESACDVLINLADCNIGKQKAVEMGGIDFLLAAVNNHLDSADVCKNAIWAITNIVKGSKENVDLLVSLGGATAVTKVKNEWPDNEQVQFAVRDLAKLIAAEMHRWARGY